MKALVAIHWDHERDSDGQTANTVDDSERDASVVTVNDARDVEESASCKKS